MGCVGGGRVSRVGGRFAPRGYSLAHVYKYCISKRGGGGARLGRTFLSLSRRRVFGCFRVFHGSLSKAVKGGLVGVRFPLRRRARNKARRFLVGLERDGLASSTLMRDFCSGVVRGCSCPRGCCVVLVRKMCSVPKGSSSKTRVFSTSSRVCRRVVYYVYPMGLSGTNLYCGTRAGDVRSHVHS